MAVLGIPLQASSSGYTIPTETATTAFGLIGGIGGGLAQIIVSRNLSERTGDRVRIRDLAIPIGLSIVGTVVAATLVPGADS